MEEERILTDSFKSFSETFIKLLPNLDDIEIKSSKNSDTIRLSTNKMFSQKNHDSKLHEKIWHSYSFAIATAPIGSEEEAKSLANRSAVLLHISKFTESIQDINRALSITKSNDLKTKLLCRKVKCLAAIGSTADIEITLQKAKHFCNKSDKSKKDALLNLLKEAEISSNNIKNETESSPKEDLVSNLQLKKDPDDFSSISIACYGELENYLIASKDINPGEVIFVEKPYVSTYNAEKVYMYCGQCFVFCWTTIPCETCSSCMYCSEKCKKEAWEQYHNYQCIPLASCIRADAFDAVLSASTRLVISAVKEAGTISNLKSNLQHLDKYKGNFFKDTFENGKLHDNGFKIIYKLESPKSSKESKVFSCNITRLLLALAKFSSFFGRRFNKEECRSLMQNEDILFIGSLLLKIMYSLAQYATNTYTDDEDGDEDPDSISFEQHNDSLKSLELAIMTTLIGSSCDPNIKLVFHPKNHNTIAYALKPIKKNNRIVHSYLSSSFYEKSKFLRQEYGKTLGFECDCEACINNWPTYFEYNRPLELLDQVFSTPSENELLSQYKKLIRLVETYDTSVLSNKVIMKLGKGIKKGISKGPYPSLVTCMLIVCLKNVLAKLYRFNPLIPDNCRVE